MKPGAIHGIHVHGFPKLFVIGMSQGGNLISNITSNLTEAGTIAAAVIAHALDAGSEEVEVSERAEADWVTLLEGHKTSFLGSLDCTPGYYNNEGREITRRHRLSLSGYPYGPVAFFDFIDRWRTDGDFEGLEFRCHQRELLGR